MLIGQYVQKINFKGRTAIPSKLKKEIGDKVILSRWYEGSLSIFAPDQWMKIIEQATLGLSVSGESRGTERFLLTGAYEIEFDEQGRFVIPPILREYAKISVSEVIFLGVGNRVEIWDKNLWKEHEKNITQNAEKLLERAQGAWNEH